MLSKHTLVITLIDELPAVTGVGAERCVVREANCRMRQSGRGAGAPGVRGGRWTQTRHADGVPETTTPTRGSRRYADILMVLDGIEPPTQGWSILSARAGRPERRCRFARSRADVQAACHS